MSDERVSFLRGRIRDVPDFPKEGILFKDITPLLADVNAFRTCIQLMAEGLAEESVGAVIGIESRGCTTSSMEVTRWRFTKMRLAPVIESSSSTI
jgi:adenine/guanine phosphoribosyltransferase-like PRPP-binding protein